MQFKQQKIVDFVSYKDAISKPEFVYSDFAKFDRPMQIHISFLSRQVYFDRFGVYPRAYNQVF